jgi:plastocyanin
MTPRSRLFALAVAMGFPIVGHSQSLLDRPPNLSGDWTGASGTLYFHFVHRFTTSDAPERKVSNVPTFLVAAGLPRRLLAGFNYSTNSTLAPRFPNEWELFARWMPLSQDHGAPLDLGAQAGYNNASDGLDAEVSVARKFGITRVMTAGRALSDPFEEGNTRLALAGGATVRLGQFVALAGDVASLLDRDSTERVAWSAGVHFAIPLTPHTVSLHATNAMLTTLQGASRGSSEVRYGFEFTIPLTLRRYFGRRAEVAVETPDTARAIVAAPVMTADPPSTSATPDSAVARPVAAPPATPSRITTTTPKTTAPKSTTPKPTATKPVSRVVKVGIKNVAYLQPRLQVTVGTTIEWTNNDPMPHTVTATNKSFDSGLINPGRTFRYTFTKAGTFNFFCVPHPFMKGTVVVRQP